MCVVYDLSTFAPLLTTYAAVKNAERTAGVVSECSWAIRVQNNAGQSANVLDVSVISFEQTGYIGRFE